MNKSQKLSPEVRERAVRMVQDHRADCPSLWTAMGARIGYKSSLTPHNNQPI